MAQEVDEGDERAADQWQEGGREAHGRPPSAGVRSMREPSAGGRAMEIGTRMRYNVKKQI